MARLTEIEAMRGGINKLCGGVIYCVACAALCSTFFAQRGARRVRKAMGQGVFAQD